MSARSSSLRSRCVVVLAFHSRGRLRATWLSDCALSGRERRRTSSVQGGERALLALDRAEGVLEPAFQGASDEAVLGLAGVELAARAIGLKLRAFEREALALNACVVLIGELADRAGGRGNGRWGDGVKERGGDSPSQGGCRRASRRSGPSRA